MQVCLRLEVEVVDSKPLKRQVCLQLEVQLVDNKPLNNAIVSTNSGSSSGQQTP